VPDYPSIPSHLEAALNNEVTRLAQTAQSRAKGKASKRFLEEFQAFVAKLNLASGESTIDPADAEKYYRATAKGVRRTAETKAKADRIKTDVAVRKGMTTRRELDADYNAKKIKPPPTKPVRPPGWLDETIPPPPRNPFPGFNGGHGFVYPDSVRDFATGQLHEGAAMSDVFKALKDQEWSPSQWSVFNWYTAKYPNPGQ
jgi:hypothetical protein